MTFRQKITIRRLGQGLFPSHKPAAWTVGGLAVVIAGLFMVGIPGRTTADTTATDTETSNRALPVQTVLPELAESFAVQRSYTGTLAANKQVDAAFQTRALIVEVMVDEGDAVTRGQPLAKLDTRRLQTEVDRLTAETAAAQARLDELVAGPRKEVIDQARAARDQNQALLDLADLRLTRVRSIHGNRSATDDELDAARLEQVSRLAALQQSQARLTELENGTRTEVIAAQRATVARLQAARDHAQIELDDAVLTAPFSGTVSQRHQDPGDLATPGSPVLGLLENQTLEARVGLPPEAASTLTAGQRVSLQAGPRTIAATLRAIKPQVDPATNTRLALFDVVNDAIEPARNQPLPGAGEIVRLRLTAEHPLSGAWLPQDSLTHSRRGLWSVFVVDGQTAKRVDVEVLHQAEGRVFVRGPLQSDQSVITGNLNKIAPGQLVRVLENASTTDIATRR